MKILRDKVFVILSILLIFSSLFLFYYYRQSGIEKTGNLVYPVSIITSAIISVGLLALPIYNFIKRNTNTSEGLYRKKSHKLFVALDSNILVNSFLYENFELLRGPSRFGHRSAKRDAYVMRLVKEGYLGAFVPEHMIREARKILKEKYEFKEEQLDKFEMETANFVYFESKKMSNLPSELIRNVSKYLVHHKDEEFVREALESGADAIITDDRRIVKNRSVLHYIPILYTPDFIEAFHRKRTNKNDLEKEAYRKAEHVMSNG